MLVRKSQGRLVRGQLRLDINPRLHADHCTMLKSLLGRPNMFMKNEE